MSGPAPAAYAASACLKSGADGPLDLSVVIVNWNTVDLLGDVLASTFGNTGGLCLEVIVIDNASSDGSVAMVARDFPQVRLIVNDDNRGFAAANNQGFAIATGRHILLLNSDTVVLGDVLAASVRFLDANRDIGAMGCRVLNGDRTMQRTCSMWPSLTNLALQTSGLWKLRWPPVLGRYLMTDWIRDSQRDVDCISGCYLMVRARVIDQVGTLDEDFFFFGEETDWCRRIADAGWRLVFAPVGEIVHYGSVSAKKLNHRRDLLLTDAMVRLQGKHSGRWAAAAAWAILFVFNLSRAVFWSLRMLIERRAPVRARALHFRNVVAGQLGMLKDTA